ETGTRGHLMSTAYIANELRRLGLKPAGDNGTFFQNVPMIRRAFDETSTITVDGKTLHGGTDFIASAPAGAALSLGVVEVVFGGRAGDTTDALTSDQLRGKMLLQLPAQRGAGRGGFGGRGGRGGGADTKLRDQYVALGEHKDHIGYLTTAPQNHDSLHLYRQAQFAISGLVRRGQVPSAEQQAQLSALRVDFDSLRRAHPVRQDSIRNGADDDGSGSVTLLEIAEAFAKAPAKPKRS